MISRNLFVAAALAAACAPAFAQERTTPKALLQQLEAAARASDARFAGFSAQRGAAFFADRHGRDLSCASCHQSDPRANGRHASTGREIAPLAPGANPQRFTDAAKTAKWFRRNCNDVLGRECTQVEKGDLLAWLLGKA